MKYTLEVSIDLPRDRVIELFDSEENLAKWQNGLKSMTHVSGEKGQVGAKTELLYKIGGRKVEMVETILARDLPDTFAARYQARGVDSKTTNRFIEDGPGRTRWVTENEFEFSGFMRLVGFFMKGSFPKQTLEDMNRFKAFAEGEGA